MENVERWEPTVAEEYNKEKSAARLSGLPCRGPLFL